MKYGAILGLIVFCGCSTVSTRIAPLASQEVSKEKYSILVRTGNPSLDKILHEFAVMEFGQLLNINEDESQVSRSGKLEILFESSSDGGLLSSSSAVSPADSTATGWYDGDRYWGGTGYSPGTSSELPSGSMLTWQYSTMLMNLKDANGNRLWSADYEYKGGSDISGFWVNTADEAARLCVKRLKARMQRDLFKGHK
jgi:hypothetical protein